MTARRKHAYFPPPRGDHVRILVITQYFWPESFKVDDLALGLQARGHSVEVLTGMPNYPAGRYFDGYRPFSPLREDYHGITIHRVPHVPRGDGRALRMALNYASYAWLASLRILGLGRRGWDVAVVFGMSPVTQAFPAVVLRRLFRVPFVHWVLDLWPESVTASGLIRSPFLVRVIGRVSSWLYRSADLVLGSSAAFAPRLQSLGVDPDRLGYLPSWAEDSYAAPVEASSSREPWEGGFAVMFAGNLGRVQGLDTVLDAAGRLRDRPEIRWVFVGDGSLRPWLEEEVRRRDLAGSVFLVGRRPVSAMPALFAKADAMLVSLKPDPIISLTVPGKLPTYLAAGRPVLGTIDGEAARVIAESGAGFVSPAGDAAGLAANVTRMVGMPPAERALLGERGRAYCRAHFDREGCLDEVEAALIRVAKAGAGRASSTRTGR
jgi:colanic acid biosynthesis glycosyl transferase WcaI